MQCTGQSRLLPARRLAGGIQAQSKDDAPICASCVPGRQPLGGLGRQPFDWPKGARAPMIFLIGPPVIRIWRKPFRISMDSPSNRRERPTSRSADHARLFSSLQRPVSGFQILIGPPAIRILPNSFRIRDKFSSNRRLLRPCPPAPWRPGRFRGRREMHPTPITRSVAYEKSYPTSAPGTALGQSLHLFANQRALKGSYNCQGNS